MAERGAHLTTTLQPKPSIFEVVASDSLNQTFQPAILRLCNVSRPTFTIHSIRTNSLSIAFLFCWFVVLGFSKPEQIRLASALLWRIVSVTQQRRTTVLHSHSRYNCFRSSTDSSYFYFTILPPSFFSRSSSGGSLSEVFYGLCRTTWSASASDETLTNRSKVTIFICLVILPYLRTKVEKITKRWQHELEDFPEYVKYRRVKQNLNKVWSGSVAVYELAQIFQYISYMANSNKSHSLYVFAIHFESIVAPLPLFIFCRLLRAVQMNLTYLPAVPENDWSWGDLFKGNFKWVDVNAKEFPKN